MSFTSSAETAVAPAPRWSDLYISVIAKAISNCGDILAATALALILQARGAGGFAVAGIMLAAALPLVVLGPVTGRLADRYDSRKLIVTAGLAQVAVCVGLAFATQPAVIIGLVAVLAAGAALVGPTMGALTPQIVGRANLAKASGISQTAVTIGMLVAPALGGVLVGAYGSRVPLLLDAATYLAIPAAGFLIKTRRGGRFGTDPRGAGAGAKPNGAAGEKADVAGGGAKRATYRMRSDRLLWPLMVLVAAVVAAISAVNVVDVFFVEQTLHSTPTAYGLIGMVWMLGMVGGAMFFARRKSDEIGTARRLLILLACSSATIGAAGLVPQVGWMIPLWLIGGAFNGGENVNIGVMLGLRAPAAFRGQASATFSSMASGANALGFVLGGVLLSVASPRLLLLASGVAGLLCAAAFAGPVRRAIARERAAAADASVTSGVVATEPAVA